jgi:hypothetical protein
MNGCISFDRRRQPGDTVVIFSCGGRADGGQSHISSANSNRANSASEGATNDGQLVSFTGGTQLVLAPQSERNATCIVPGNGRLESAPCANDDSQVFTIVT